MDGRMDGRKEGITEGITERITEGITEQIAEGITAGITAESRQNHGRIMALKLGFGGAVFGLTVVAGGEGKQDRVWYGRR